MCVKGRPGVFLKIMPRPQVSGKFQSCFPFDTNQESIFVVKNRNGVII